MDNSMKVPAEPKFPFGIFGKFGCTSEDIRKFLNNASTRRDYKGLNPEKLPGGTESAEVNMNSFIEVDGMKFYGMYRGRWLHDMSKEELLNLVAELHSKNLSLRGEMLDIIEQL